MKRNRATSAALTWVFATQKTMGQSVFSKARKRKIKRICNLHIILNQSNTDKPYQSNTDKHYSGNHSRNATPLRYTPDTASSFTTFAVQNRNARAGSIIAVDSNRSWQSQRQRVKGHSDFLRIHTRTHTDGGFANTCGCRTHERNWVHEAALSQSSTLILETT